MDTFAGGIFRKERLKRRFISQMRIGVGMDRIGQVFIKILFVFGFLILGNRIKTGYQPRRADGIARVSKLLP